MQIFHSIDWVRDVLRTPLLLASAISLLAGGLLTLFWSHRFVAPLRVISAAVGRIRNGNLSVPVRVRTTDAHQDFARQFQHMQEDLRKMVEADRARVAEATLLLEAVEKTLPADHEARHEIVQAIDYLRQTGTKYHL